jgi:hypothetical protein
MQPLQKCIHESPGNRVVDPLDPRVAQWKPLVWTFVVPSGLCTLKSTKAGNRKRKLPEISLQWCTPHVCRMSLY